MLEREQQADQRVDPGVGIADAVGLERQVIRVSRHPGESRSVLDGVGEGRKLAPWPVEPETRHPQHDEIGPIGPQRLEVQAELVEHTWRVVLDDHVACGDDSVDADRSRVARCKSIVRLFLLVLSPAKIGARSHN